MDWKHYHAAFEDGDNRYLKLQAGLNIHASLIIGTVFPNE